MKSVIQVKYDDYISHRGLADIGLFIDIYLTEINWTTKPVSIV